MCAAALEVLNPLKLLLQNMHTAFLAPPFLVSTWRVTAKYCHNVVHHIVTARNIGKIKKIESREAAPSARFFWVQTLHLRSGGSAHLPGIDQ